MRSHSFTKVLIGIYCLLGLVWFSSAGDFEAVDVVLFPEAQLRLIHAEEVVALDDEDLRQAINERFALRGYKFDTDEGKSLVAQLGDAYHPVSDNQEEIEKTFSRNERENLQLFVRVREARRKAPGSSFYKPLFAKSSETLLEPMQIATLTSYRDCQRAINEIYARHGFPFDKEDGKQLAKALGVAFKRSDAPKESITQLFSDIEAKNVSALTKHRDQFGKNPE